MKSKFDANLILRKLLAAGFLLIAVAGCSGRSDSAPTLMPTTALGGNLQSAGNESPRMNAGGALPPTWTPPPVVEAATPPPVVPQATEPAGETYVVQPGDTLAELALRFEVDLEDLALTNGVDNVDLIEVGQVLTIPR